MRDGVIIIFMVLLSNFLLTASFFVTRESLGNYRVFNEILVGV